MPDLYFNPYPGSAKDIEAGKYLLVRTAESINALRKSIDGFIDCQAESFLNFTIVRNKNHIEFDIKGLIPYLRGRERTLVVYFLSLMARGRKISLEEFKSFDDLILADLEVPAPVLQFALLNDGLIVTIPTDSFWEKDFLSFVDCEQQLPNIWGQEDVEPLEVWIREWSLRGLRFQEKFEKKFNITFCSGALKINEFSSPEWDIVFRKMEEAQVRDFEHNGYLVKDVGKTDGGPLKEIKHRGSGIRFFILKTKEKSIFGGVYKKGQGTSPGRESIAQSKAIEKAIERINDHLKKT